MANILDKILNAGIDILAVAKDVAPKGKVIGNDYTALCPFHSEKTPSYKINIKTGLTHCFGCGHSGDIVKDYKETHNLPSLVEAKNEILAKYCTAPTQAPKAKDNNQQLKKAQAIWNKAVSDHSTLRRYFRTRGLNFKQYPNIRLYQGYESELYQNGKPTPITAMICRITDAYGNFKSLHITELIEEKGKIIRKHKRLFKGLEVKGSFAAFGDINKTKTVGIAEGIETALSIKEAMPNLCVIASLSASFMPSIILPSNIENIYIFADNDTAGLNAAAQLQKRLQQENKNAIVISPKKEDDDFNDVLRKQGIDAILQAFADAQIPEKKETNKKITVLKGFSPRQITNALRDKFNLFVDKSRTLWLYDETQGTWIKDADYLIERILRNEILAEELAKKYVINEVIEDVKGTLYENKLFPEMPLHFIPFTNGVYNIETDELQPYEPEHYATFKLPVAYNPTAAEPKTFLKFLNEVYDDAEELLQIMAYTLYRSYPYQKIIFLYGSGGNGKSTFLSILSAILGKPNISTVSLKEMIENRFMAAELHNKLANISVDEPSFTITNSSKIKALTGGDIITAERKNKQPFQFKNFAKLIVATNSLPRTDDKTPAFYRRIHLIKFNKKFEGSIEKRDLAQKIINNTQEMEGIAKLMIEHLKVLIDRDFNIKNSQKSEEIAKQYEKLANPIETFIETFTAYSSNPADFITKSEFKKAINIWLKNNNLQVMSDKQISKEMRNLGYVDKPVKQGAKINKVWIAIKWIPEAVDKLIAEETLNFIYKTNNESEIDEIDF